MRVDRLRTWAMHERRLLVATLPVAAFVLVAIFGPWLAPYSSVEVFTRDRLLPPGAARADGSVEWLGTDRLGRSMVAQVVQGARVSVLVGTATVLIAGVVGTALGLVAGYFGGWSDRILMRLADIQLAFPPIVLAILIVAALGPSVTNVILTLAVTRWVRFARVVRSATLSIREREHVAGAVALGAGDLRVLWRHVLPLTLSPALVIATVDFGFVILAEAGLSFLGLGTPQTIPSWGLTIAQGRDYLVNGWWISAIPGLALVLLVTSVGHLGDLVRDRLDPHLRGP